MNKDFQLKSIRLTDGDEKIKQSFECDEAVTIEKQYRMKISGGIHHITAITGDPQKNIDFYEGFLGQKLIKRTVNFDDPSSYHFYFGDAFGKPGCLLTFFYWPSIPTSRPGWASVTRAA